MKPYSLYKRKFTRKGKKDSIIYYCQFRDEQGQRLTAISTGCTNKASAENWAIKHLKQGFIPKKQNMTFESFTENFFVGGKCEYLKYLLAHGKHIGERHTIEQRSKLNKRLIPYFGKMKLSNIKSYDIEKWISTFDGSGLNYSTINSFTQTLRTILDEALRKDLISVNPCDKVIPLSGQSKIRGILTPEEVRKLFCDSALPTVWKDDLQIFTINMLSVSTGLRLGECLALQFKNLNVIPNFLHITSSWEKTTRNLKGTKTGKSRYVPLPSRVEDYLNQCIELLKYREPEDLIFCRPHKRGKPITGLTVQFGYQKALQEIGISEIDRKKRCLSFHCHRHFFNSFLRVNKIADPKIRELTGHSSEAMTENYSHILPSDYEDVRTLQNRLFVD
jgi:integrase